MQKRKSLQDRIAQYAHYVLPSGCVIWAGYTDVDGYAIAHFKADGVGRNMKVHRLVYEEAHGPIADGMMVCHRCDVRSCVNPDHLFLGTAKDNVADMWAKGRWRPGAQDNRGERNPRARLSHQDVASIRAKRSAGIGAAELAKDYGVSRSHVQRICRGQMWAERSK
jgi:hypothetical protein